MNTLIAFPGKIGSVIALSAKGAIVTVGEPLRDGDAPFRVGDVCSFTPFPYRFRVVAVDEDRVQFKRIS